MSFPLDEGLLEIFSNSFYGYGQYPAPLWFVGPHATLLGRDRNEAARRLELWHRRGQPQTVDLRQFYSMIGEKQWFGEIAKLHRVWSKLARIALAFEGKDIAGRVRLFQSEHIGRTSGRNLLLHLLPVENADTHWPYIDLDTSYLRRPNLYVNRFGERRAHHIARQIRRYQPAVVVFYDLTHKQWWKRIAGTDFRKTPVRDCYAAEVESTLCLVVRHPESIGTRNDYFEHVGELAASVIASTAE